MLEHSAMYLNVPPQYEDDTSFFPDFYTRWVYEIFFQYNKAGNEKKKKWRNSMKHYNDDSDTSE